MSFFDDVREFHNRFGLATPAARSLVPADLTPELQDLRQRMQEEELQEWKDATTLDDKVDALLDGVYFALGTVDLYGVDANLAWQRIHEANMKKVRANGDGKRGSDFDVVKPPGWRKPDHRDLVGEAPRDPELQRLNELTLVAREISQIRQRLMRLGYTILGELENLEHEIHDECVYIIGG